MELIMAISKKEKQRRKKIADRLKEYLDRKEVSIYKLTKLTGIKTSTMYAYMNGKMEVPREVCAVIADVVDEQLSEVFPHLSETGPELVDLKEQIEKTGGVEYDPLELADNGQELKMKQKLNEEEPEMVTEEQIEEKLDQPIGKQITANDLVAGAASLYSEDGIVLKSRMIRDMDGNQFEGYKISPDEQVIVMTGIKASFGNRSAIA